MELKALICDSGWDGVGDEFQEKLIAAGEPVITIPSSNGRNHFFWFAVEG